MSRYGSWARSRSFAIGLLVASLFASLAHGQQGPPAAANAASSAAFTGQLIKTGLYVIDGGGSNTLMRFSASGIILVDGKLPGNYRPLMSQVRKINKISDLPVRVLIVTDHRENHTGNDEQFLGAGVPILAQANAKRRLPGFAPPSGRVAPPVISFDREYILRFGGVEVQCLHFGNAHTDGDTVVYFPDLRVVALGDLFSEGPDPDYSAGGSLVGWGSVLAEVLKLDFDIAVPSAGRAVTRAEVEAFKSKIETVVSRAEALVKSGVPKDRLMRDLKTDDVGWRLQMRDDQVDGFYAELAQLR